MNNVEDLLLELIKVKSETGYEKQLSDYLANYCKSLGFDKIFQDRFGNVIAVIDAGHGKILNFNAHMDTVGGFFTPKISQEKVFGRGAADMKGAIASMLFSAKELIKQKEKLRGKAVYSFVVCEESGEPAVRKKGTKSVIEFFKQRNLIPTAVVIGESSQIDLTDDIAVVYRQRGRCTIDVSFLGSSAHGSFGMKKGANSYILANKFCHKIYKYSRKLNVSELSINIAGGRTIDLSYNKVPKETQVQLEIRFSTDELLKEAEEKIKECADKAVTELIEEIKSVKKSFVSKKDLSSIGYKFTGNNLHNGIGKRIYGSFDSRKSDFLKLVLNESKKTPGCKKVKSNSSVFGTDASFYLEAGIFKGIPDLVVFGPGSQLKAHTSDEFVKISHLNKYIKLYSNLALNYLNDDA